MQARYELFDHTADIGIRVFAPTMAELIRPAGEGLYAVIGQLVGGGEAEPARWEFKGPEPAILLRDYLGELLVLCEREHRIVEAPAVTAFTARELSVTARTLSLDEEKSVYRREVKAVTYHELAVVRIPGGFQATIIVDI